MAIPKREEAIILLNDYIKTDFLIKHSLATEAILRGLARRMKKDEDLWGITGLLHDLDLELVEYDVHKHAYKTVEILKERYDYPQEGLQAILAHNGDVLGIECVSDLDNALTAGESITGLIMATALVYPSKKLTDVKIKSVRKRIKEHRFAAKISRERIKHYENLPIPDSDFFEISLNSLKEISSVLGL